MKTGWKRIAAMLSLTALLAASVPASFAAEDTAAAAALETAAENTQSAESAASETTAENTQSVESADPGVLDSLSSLFREASGLLFGSEEGTAVSAAETAANYKDASVISLSDDGITVDGSAASTDESAAVYTANDIIYYEDRDTYDDGYTYGEGSDADKHTAEEAAANTVVHITQPGTYIISGKLSAGQIFVDLGKNAESDPNAVVTLVFAGADITCEVAPAVIFYRVYECDTAWTAYDNGETTAYEASAEQDTSGAGANVIIADGSINNINGSYVAKIYKDNADQKKKYKFDGAFYSRMSMNIDGEDDDSGVLNITAENEGLDTEQHLTINGGTININSQDDGINTNEDEVSVTTINGGTLHIVAGLGKEGDGIDSNGYLVINGGVVIATANPAADSGLDSDLGSYVNGGYVVATGSTMDWPESESDQVTMNLQFASMQASDEAMIVTDTDGKVIFAYDPDKDETSGANNRSYQGMVVSCPEFEVGQTYHVYVGGDVEGTEVNGLYDASTASGFSGAVQQEYTGTDVGGRMGGPGNAGEAPTPPDGEQNGEAPTPPEGEQSGEAPTPPDGKQDGDRPTPPDGEQNGEAPTPPDGEQDGDRPTPPDGGQNGQKPDEQNGGTVGTASTEFYMTDKVNAFSGVTDAGTSTGGTGTFEDVEKDAYYAEAVAWAVSQDITKGTGEKTFSPAQECTRGQMVTFLYRAAGSPEVTATDNPFTDVEEDTYYYDAVLWAVQEGITKGMTDTTFEPDAKVTRGQAVTFLYRLNGEKTVTGDNPFSDVSEDDFFHDAVIWAADQGIAKGMSDTTFEPDTICQRAHIVTFLYRCFGK